MNTAFVAKKNSDELWDTLFFSGVEFMREKTIVNGLKQYSYITPSFTLTISGTTIKINDKKFNLVEAKKWIMMNS